MAAKRYLIVNADDFGLSRGVNRGIIEAHESGIVTSASLMVRWPAAEEAASYGRRHPDLSLGLHIDLAEWAYRDGSWMPLYEIVPPHDPQALTDEVFRQLDMFMDLIGRKPSHVDSHQHGHRQEPLRSVLAGLARDLDVPIRDACSEVRYCGEFYGQTAEGDPLPEIIGTDGLMRILAGLPPGVTELGCHPGYADDLDTMYRTERTREIGALCDPRVRACLAAQGIELCSFGDLRFPDDCR